MNPKPYTDSDRSNRLWWYLLLITLLSAFCFITLDVWLLPCSIAYHETGTMTAGYLLYAAIGLLFSTPTPFIAVLIISLFITQNSPDHRRFLFARDPLCRVVWNAERLPLVYASYRLFDHGTVCRHRRGNWLAWVIAAGDGYADALSVLRPCDCRDLVCLAPPYLD